MTMRHRKNLGSPGRGKMVRWDFCLRISRATTLVGLWLFRIYPRTWKGIDRCRREVEFRNEAVEGVSLSVRHVPSSSLIICGMFKYCSPR